VDDGAESLPGATDQRPQAEALVQQVLAPFIAELGQVHEELGRVKAECAAAERAMAELRERADQAERLLVTTRRWAEQLQAERDQLRAAQEVRRPPRGGGGRGRPAGDTSGPLQRLWRALRGGRR
jgi:chromosome segregation ATPase